MKEKTNKHICTQARAGTIVFHKKDILLIYRKKSEKVYYTFPGGMIESGETIKNAAVRELFEEASIIANPERILYHMQVVDKNCRGNDTFNYKNEFFVLCSYVSGVPCLNTSSEEFKRINNDNIYKPMWVQLSKIKKLHIYPLEIKNLLINDLESQFSSDVKKIKVSCSKLHR